LGEEAAEQAALLTRLRVQGVFALLTIDPLNSSEAPFIPASSRAMLSATWHACSKVVRAEVDGDPRS